MKRDYRRRSGTVLVCVLTCCLTAISLGAIAVRLGLQSARESKQTLRLRQTQWLLQAGVQRARQQLTDPDYSGEVWLLPLLESLGTEPRIVIVVAPSDSTDVDAELPGPELTVRVTAEYGERAGGGPPLRRSHVFLYQRHKT